MKTIITILYLVGVAVLGYHTLSELIGPSLFDRDTAGTATGIIVAAGVAHFIWGRE